MVNNTTNLSISPVASLSNAVPHILSTFPIRTQRPTHSRGAANGDSVYFLTDSVTGEQLWDVTNEQGLPLLLGVTLPEAHRIINERLSEGDMHPQWQCEEIRIKWAHRGAGNLKWNISTQHFNGRLVVCCEIHNFLRSGLTVAGMLDKLRPDLVAAIEAAAARAPCAPPMLRPVSVGIDVGTTDPEILLEVRDPAACLSNLAEQLGLLRRIAERMIYTETLPQ